MFLYRQETDSSLWSKLVEYPSFHCFLRQMRFPLELRSEEQNIAGPLRGEKEMQVIWPLNRLKHSLFFRRGHPWTDVRQTSLRRCLDFRTALIQIIVSVRRSCLRKGLTFP
jgi:hypothetical protein